jgi:peptidoglycan L-alanyl-D-glutamate endopeptidase CwlK
MNKFKLLIVTTDKKTLEWKSLKSKLALITNGLNKTVNASWEVAIEYKDIKPKIILGRIPHDWFNNFAYPLFREGNHFIYLHFSTAQRKALGLDTTINGANQKDADYVGESYGWSDERTRRQGQNMFVQNILHEMSHELARSTNSIDNTHPYHSKNTDISGLFSSYNMDLWQPRYKAQLKELNLAMERLEALQDTLARSIPALQPIVARKADLIVTDMEKLGQPVRVVEGYRSLEKQAQLYAQGRTTPGSIVTNAKPGESFHNYGVAVDFVFRKEGYNATQAQWEMLGKVGEKHGFEWGGRWIGFVDRPHFEMKLGYTLKDYQQNKVDYTKFN